MTMFVCCLLQSLICYTFTDNENYFEMINVSLKLIVKIITLSLHQRIEIQYPKKPLDLIEKSCVEC